MRVAIGLMIGLCLLAAGEASAQMTPADEAGMAAFAACLDEAENDETSCLNKLGRYAWYPKDDTSCEVVAARVHEAINSGAQAEWKDLFFNERCARLELPHDREAAKVGDQLDPKSAYGACAQDALNPIQCEATLGRHKWYPWADGACESLRHTESVFFDLGWAVRWKELFYSERCNRLSEPYFAPEH